MKNQDVIFIEQWLFRLWNRLWNESSTECE